MLRMNLRSYVNKNYIIEANHKEMQKCISLCAVQEKQAYRLSLEHRYSMLRMNLRSYVNKNYIIEANHKEMQKCISLCAVC